MPSFGAVSVKNLIECDLRLQLLFNRAIQTFDCSIICGRRTNAEQARLFALGLSRARPGESKHNVDVPDLSRAVDVYPYPHEEPDLRRFYYFGGFVMGLVVELDLPIRWGGDWHNELLVHKISNRRRHTFDDLAHWEIVD